MPVRSRSHMRRPDPDAPSICGSSEVNMSVLISSLPRYLILSLRIIFLTSHLSIFKVLYSQPKSALEHLSQPSDHRSLQLIEDNIIRFFRKLGIFRPYQRHTDFCMRSIWEHIYRLYFLNLISPGCQGGQVSGLGLRVAGYVNDSGGCQLYKRI